MATPWLNLSTKTLKPDTGNGRMVRWRGLARYLLCLAILASQPVLAETDHEIQSQRLAELRSQIQQLQTRLDQVQGQQNLLQNQLRKTERAITSSSLKLRSIKSQLHKAQRKKKGLTSERRQLENTLNKQRQQLADQLRAAYATGRQERLKLLLNQESPATVGRLLVYYQHLNQARSELIDAVKANVARLAQLEYELAEQTESLRALNAQQEERNRQLSLERSERSEVLAKLNNEAKDKQGRLTQYQADEQRLQELLKALDLALADIPEQKRKPFHARKGKMPWPTKGKLAARFGNPRATGKLRWNGVLIAAKEGNEVHAISHGRVAFADWLRGFGLLIIIDHDDGYMSLYGHNQTLFKEPGDWVEDGELLAEVGDSGGQENHGLYFEIRHNGRPVNPLGWCRRPVNNRVGQNELLPAVPAVSAATNRMSGVAGHDS